MIYIGNQTACWAASPTEPFAYAIEQEFDAFEWFPDKKPDAGWDEGDLDRCARKEIGDAARACGMRLSVHARWQADPLAPDGYPLLWRDLELAQDLGAALLNIHLFHEQGAEAFVEAIVPLVRRTAEAGLQLAIENTPDHSPEQFNELFACIRARDSVKTSHVGMCLDVGHANLCSATRNDYLAFYDRLDRRVPIIHLHFHENWGDADSHLPLFTGPASRDDSGIRRLMDRLSQRGFSGSVILEQWPHPPALLNQARDRLLQLWDASAGTPTDNINRAPSVPEPQAGPEVPGGDLAAELALGNQRCRSWREKLEMVRGLLAKEVPALTPDQLVDIAIYLRFLGTGEIACAEDGRHFRPAHHARIASQIQERLARLTTPDNEFIVRKIYPWLPSSAPTFQRPEPLTRVRDIAHRSDIGPDLKREIKTTLQNKLHRCAGPEDLVTSSALLERISPPATGYAPAFVEQFRIFHEELKEFFNARSLDERLKTLLPTVDSAQAGLIRLFLEQKTGSALPGQLAAFGTLTSLRQGFLGMAARKTSAEAQAFLQADIALEDFAFVLLSEIINGCETTKPETATEFQTGALILALKNLALSGVERPETQAVQGELREWGRLSSSAGREEALRLKATVQRCRRLAEDFGARTVALFSGRVEKLGRALDVAEHAIRIFSESDLRGHLVFQVSKLASGLLRRIRKRLGLPAWDVLVGGRAVGRVITVAALEDLERDRREPAVVLLKNAAGDEEIPASVAGIVLAQQMPHLSHLCLRARQAGVVFVTCEEPRELEGLRECEGQQISLLALPDSVTWESAPAASAADASAPPRPSPHVPSVRLAPESLWVPLEGASPETSGGKAVGARRLAELSRQEGAGFQAVKALVVPFGVMELALAAAPTVDAEYRDLVKQLDARSSSEFAPATRRLQELVHQLAVPDAIVAEVSRQFAGIPGLIVRSSANCEDLEEFAGAGLYESVINVAPAKVDPAIRAVWASLWTSRAALSRREAGIAQGQAHMAVLVQELLDPDLSFVLHTVNPGNRNAKEVYAEIVVGLGETLASAATRGSAYRLACNTQSGAVITLAFANFSQASRPNSGGGTGRETVDYSRIALSREAAARSRLGRRLAGIGAFVEQVLGKPQHIEGVVVKDQVYLVQVRPQPGLGPRKDL